MRLAYSEGLGISKFLQKNYSAELVKMSWRNYNIIIEQSKMNLKSEAFLKRR